VLKATLRNGLRLVASPVAGTSFAHLCLAVKVGSRYESPRQNGFSHFVEHLLFRGSE
jgi:predicted Zn-dependent peptidase